MSDEGLVDRLIAASHDERLSTGMLYREAAQRIEHLHAQLVALRAERDSLQKRVTECESVMLHYGMETEHSCMCQFNDDTDELAGECAYHEKIRAERDEAVALLREMRGSWPYCEDVAPVDRDRIDAFLAKHKEQP